MSRRNAFEYHDSFLHARLLQPSLRRLTNGDAAADYDKTAEAVFKRIQEVPIRRKRDLALRLGIDEPTLDKLSATGIDQRASTASTPTYVPSLYSLWGSYDLAAVYLSPSLTPLPAAPELEVRQSEFSLFLPKLGTGDEDCNAHYLQSVGKASSHEQPKDAGDRFLAIVQIKLSPYSTWSKNQNSRTHEAVRSIAQTVQAWRNEQPGRRKSDQTRAALGLSLSWHEVVLVAHASDLHPLLDLILRVRRSQVPVGKQASAHTALVTSSTLGFDYAIESAAAAAAAGLRPDATLEQLQESANRVSEDLSRQSHRAGRRSSKPKGPRVTCRTHFCINPGHEKPFLQFFDEHEQAERNTSFNVGGYDTSSPAFDIHPIGKKSDDADGNHVDAIAAAALTTMLRTRLFRGATRSDGRGRQDFFASASSISTSASSDCDDVPKDHVDEDPRRHLFGSNWNQLAPNGPAEMRNLLRVLQVTYEDTEQVINTVSVLRWTWDSMWLWEGTVELRPVVSSLVDYLRRLAARLRDLHENPASTRRKAVEQRLRHLSQDIGETLAAVRTVLSAPHWSVAPIDSNADLNLRRPGNLEQIRSIATLVGWTMVGTLLDPPRACIATVGEPVSQASLQVDVVLLRVPIAIVEQPLFFDELASHVATMFLEVLNEFDVQGRPNPEGNDPGGSVDLRQLAEAYHDLRECSDATDSKRLLLGANFYLASLLLEVDTATLARSLLLQGLLRNDACQIRASSLDSEANDRGAARTTYEQETVLTLVMRILFGEFCRDLAASADEPNADGDLNDREEFDRWVRIRDRLRASAMLLRERLYKECLVHPGGRGQLHDLFEKNAWDKFVGDQIEACGWLRSPRVLRMAASFFRDSRRYVQERLAGTVKVSKPAALARSHWATARARLRDIRDFLLNNTHNVTVTSGYLDEDERIREPVRENDARFADYDRLRLPPARMADAHSPPLDPSEAVVCQRGRLFFVSDATTAQWARHVASFYGSMIALQPSIRRAIGNASIQASARLGDRTQADENIAAASQQTSTRHGTAPEPRSRGQEGEAEL